MLHQTREQYFQWKWTRGQVFGSFFSSRSWRKMNFTLSSPTCLLAYRVVGGRKGGKWVWGLSGYRVSYLFRFNDDCWRWWLFEVGTDRRRERERGPSSRSSRSLNEERRSSGGGGELYLWVSLLVRERRAAYSGWEEEVVAIFFS